MTDKEIKQIADKLTYIEASITELVYDITCKHQDQELALDLFKSFKEQIFKIIGKNVYNEVYNATHK